MPAQVKLTHVIGGVVLGVLLTISAFIVWALWSGNNSQSTEPNGTLEQNSEAITLDNGYLEYEPKVLKPGVFERIWVNPLVEENPDRLNLLEIDSDETVQNAYIVSSEYYKAASMASNLSGFYSSHLDQGIDPILASGYLSNDEYKKLALGKFHYIFKNLPLLEEQITQGKERNKGADYSGIEFSLVQGKRKINEAITLYNNGEYGQADLAAYAGGVWINSLQNILHEPVNEYQRLLSWYETDLNWASLFLAKEDNVTRDKLNEIQKYLDEGNLEVARKLYKELENSNEVVKAVGVARSLNEKNPQIWGALHWLASDLQAFETVNYDLLSDSVSRYSNNLISNSELSSRQSIENCYVAVAGFVYDITTLLNFKNLHPALPVIEQKCGTDISNYIASQPVEPGSVNTARFKWILWWFEIGVVE